MNTNEEDNKFWIEIWALLLVSSMAITIMMLTFNYYKDYNEKVVRLIAGGVSPLEVNCAFNDKKGKNPTCLELAKKN